MSDDKPGGVRRWIVDDSGVYTHWDGPISFVGEVVDAKEHDRIVAEKDRIIDRMKAALESMLDHVCDGGGDRPCSQMWFQDVAEEALAEIEKGHKSAPPFGEVIEKHFGENRSHSGPQIAKKDHK